MVVIKIVVEMHVKVVVLLGSYTYGSYSSGNEW